MNFFSLIYTLFGFFGVVWFGCLAFQRISAEAADADDSENQGQARNSRLCRN
jgi:hypothetical protein